MNRSTRHPLLTLAYALAGMLAISALLITLARNTGQSQPSVGSFNPSGLTLFGSLLRDMGYQVQATRDPTPSLRPERDVAVVVSLDRTGQWAVPDREIENLEARLLAFVQDGGTVISGTLGADFQAVTRAARPVNAKSDLTGVTQTITSNPSIFRAPAWVESGPSSLVLWRDGPNDLVHVGTVGKGTVLHFTDFTLATNRFIDQNDNANVLMAGVQEFVPKGKRLVFLEAAWGNRQETGFFESIGSWAVAAWKQILILGVVVVLTLGKPFGLPESRRPTQHGQRELVDAFAALLRRARATDIALEAVAEDADRRLRRALKINSGLDKADMRKQLPDDLQGLLSELDRAIALRVPNDVAVALASRVEREVANFAGDRRVPARKRRKA